MSEVRKALVAGIMIGEAGVFCYRYRGYRSPVIDVGMCDEKAVNLAAEGWGVSVVRGRERACRPTPHNPKGQSYVARRRGTAAKEVIDKYRPYLEGTELLAKWNRLLQTCPVPRLRKRLKPVF